MADCRSGRLALEFFFNLPFGLVAFVMASLLVSDSNGGGNTPFDREDSCSPAAPKNQTILAAVRCLPLLHVAAKRRIICQVT
jgi:hypothetical protein